MNSIGEALRRRKMDPKSAALFTKHFSHVNIKLEEQEFFAAGVILPERIVVQPIWKDVDRPIVGGWSCGMDTKLAGRLQQAIESGALFCKLEFKTDSSNQTYISATDLILGRTMNADLKKLGY
jgi:hypothetical protein